MIVAQRAFAVISSALPLKVILFLIFAAWSFFLSLDFGIRDLDLLFNPKAGADLVLVGALD